MKCIICGISVDTIDEAVDQDWIPFFYEGEEPHGPACADCCETLFHSGEGGETRVKEEFRGKIVYQHEEEPELECEEPLVMGLIFN